MVRRLILLLGAVLLLGVVSNAFAVNYYWDDDSGDHRVMNGVNWDPDNPPFPNKTNWLVIANVPAYPGVGAVMDYAQDGTVGWGIAVGYTGTGNLTVTNGATMRSRGDLYVGLGDAGIVDMPDGYIGVGGKAYLGWDGGSATINVSGANSGLNVYGYHTRLYAAGGDPGGTCTINISDGYVRSKEWLMIGASPQCTAVVNMTGGELNQTDRAGNRVSYIGNWGDGTLNISGGEVYMRARMDVSRYTTDQNKVGPWQDSYGHIEMSGGKITANHPYFEVNAKTMGWPTPEVRGTIHQTAGEFLFTNPGTIAYNRVNQAVHRGWWTTAPCHRLIYWRDGGGTHVIVEPPLEVDIDILPSDDPNLLTVNMQSKGRLPIAILGSAENDVSQINISSLHIGETTFAVRLGVIDDINEDGFDDVMLHFSRRDVIAALGLDEMEPGEVVPITVQGVLTSGRCVLGTDDVVLEARSD
ncbi:MAG: hypothetical protein ACYTF1_20635 [Planctomycetota bacterium]